MRKKSAAILWVVCIFAVNGSVRGESADEPRSTITTDVVTISVEQQYETVLPGSKSALAIHFELKKDWHFYASAKTAPGAVNLKIKPSAKDYISFSRPIFPQPQLYFDKVSNKKLEVFSDKFTVFLPFSVARTEFETGKTSVNAKIGIEGTVCSDIQCRVPDFGELRTEIRIDSTVPMSEPNFFLPDLTEAPQVREPELTSQLASYSVWFALGLAFLAGLSLNIMPCVWPVLPIIVMRIVEQAKAGRKQSIVMGLAFCLGILLFFACLAGSNIILRVSYGTVLQWGDHLRNPIVAGGLALLLVVLALFMFGVFTITVPSSIAGKSGSGKGYPGAVGMGFLAAVLSTPCSFAILAAAFAWAQLQPLPLGTFAIMVIGLGMAVPYAILTSMPGLLKRLPKAGRWMELFKQGIGFVLLIIAVKMIKGIPATSRIGVLYFAVVLSFCIWMWSSWVGYGTKLSRKLVVRGIAVLLVIGAWLFLFAPELVDWQEYDANLIEAAIAEKRPVLIKFTADWCTICDVVDKVVYGRKDIAKLIEQKGILAIKADTTLADYPATIALKNKYEELGVPVSILYIPGEKEPLRFHKIFFAKKLKGLLKKLPSK